MKIWMFFMNAMMSLRENRMNSLSSGWIGYFFQLSFNFVVVQMNFFVTFFKLIYDSLFWILNRRPDDWTLSAGGSGTIYGWGHNHRGQLGGIEGAKVKVPTPCEALATLRPVQLIGGEQTLFAVTADGKVSIQ